MIAEILTKEKIKVARNNIFDFIRYDVSAFFKNIFLFRKELLHFRNWDFEHNLSLLKKSLELTAKSITFYSNEIEEDKINRLLKLHETIDAIEYYIESKHFDDLDKQGLKCPKMYTVDNENNFSELKFEEDTENYFGKLEKFEEDNWHKIWKLIDENMRGWWN